MKVFLLVHAFWEETGTDLTMASIKLCWEPTPRAIYCKREDGPIAHIITFLDELAVQVTSLDAWDQLVWPSMAAVPQALTEAELYGYCYGQVVDLSPVMPGAQFWVTDKGGTYLCIVRAILFEGSVLAYNPAKNEESWFPCMASPMILHVSCDNETTCFPANYVKTMHLDSLQEEGMCLMEP